jgi:hypothetical protein
VLKCITPKAKQPRPLAHTPRPRAREEAAQFVFQPAANEVFKKAINISQKGRAGLGAAHLKVPSTLLGVCQKFHVLVVFSPLTLHSIHSLSAGAVRPRVFYLLSASWCRLLLCANFFHSYTNFIMLMCAWAILYLSPACVCVCEHD